MFDIIGSMTIAHVKANSLDEATYNQILSFCNDPLFEGNYIVIQADAHYGAGTCIGFTTQMNDKVNPNVIGVDGSCGMLSCMFPVDHIDLPSFDEFIHKNIPAGFCINDKAYLGEEFYLDTAKKVGADLARVNRSLGTLGQGNHYCELGKDSNGFIWATIHSGSRNLGLQIANYHMKKAKDFVGEGYPFMPFLETYSPEGKDYLNDLSIGAKYASLNRKMMMDKIIDFFGIPPLNVIESIHNFIDDSGMIRKGATSAHEGEMLLIPFNMRDGMAICKGKGNPTFNYSAPHGAGRILSRSKAKQTLDVEYFKEDMKQAGVYTTTANASTLDESPDAYKDFHMILEAIQETVTVDEMVKPIYNFKEGGE